MSEATIFRIQQEDCDGVSVFPSLGQLADHLERSLPHGAPLPGDGALDMASIQIQMGGRANAGATGKHYDYYYDSDRVGTGGDGSEHDPWPDLVWWVARFGPTPQPGASGPRAGRTSHDPSAAHVPGGSVGAEKNGVRKRRCVTS